MVGRDLSGVLLLMCALTTSGESSQSRLNDGSGWYGVAETWGPDEDCAKLALLPSDYDLEACGKFAFDADTVILSPEGRCYRIPFAVACSAGHALRCSRPAPRWGMQPEDETPFESLKEG